MKTIIMLIFLPLIAFSQNKWEKVELEGPSRLQSFKSLDSNLYYYVSTYYNIYKSTNGGYDWDIIYNSYLYETNIDKTEIPDSNSFFVNHYGTCLVKSLNEFKSLDTVCSGNLNFINIFKMYNSKVGFVSRYEVDTSGGVEVDINYVVTTNNSFKTEDKLEISNSWFLMDGDFLNENEFIFLMSDTKLAPNKYVFYLMKYNLNTKEFDTIHNFGDEIIYYSNMEIYKNNIYICGVRNPIKGGTGRNYIIKSSDYGKTWKCVQDIYYSHRAYNVPDSLSDPWGMYRIKFKNDSIGIIIGNSKICYTYDVGESWYFETQYSTELKKDHLYANDVDYAGDMPIYVKYNEHLFRMTEDNLAPKAQDILVISGYVMEDEKPQAEIPVALDNRITMTDSSGYYQFIQIRPGKEYTLQVYNKYFNYRPFFYYPDKIQISTTNDTIINFQASSKKIFHNISGNVYNNQEGIKDISIQSIKHISTSGKEYDTVKTNEEGFYLFENIEQGFNYTYKAFSDEYTFTPEEYSYVGITEDKTGFNFVASPITSVKSNSNFEFKSNILYSKEIVGHIYRLIDLQGRVIKSSNLSPTIDFNYLDSGTYILQVMKNNSEVFSEKFQVVR